VKNNLNMKVPNDVKMFLWRASNDLLPIENLLKRGFVRDSLYFTCRLEGGKC
jgi:hypothetical protein